MKDIKHTGIRILHLSDIHLGGTWHDNSIDDKTMLIAQNIDKHSPIDLLASAIRKIRPKPNYVVISGDIAHQGNEEKQKEFFSTITKLSSENHLPRLDKILVVPGNHDGIETSIDKREKKYENFFANTPSECICPYRAGINRLEEYEKVVETNLLHPGTKSKLRLPYILDKKNKVMIYALNSSQFCQCTMANHYSGKDVLIDLPRVDESELELMGFTFAKAKALLKSEFSEYLTVCVMHHNLSPIAAFEEDKYFEGIPNAGAVKKIVSECGIKLILHGHKHWPEVYFDTAVNDNLGFASISGGSICVTPNHGSPGFFVIDMENFTGDWISAQYCAVGAQNNGKIVTNESIRLVPPAMKFSMPFSKKDILQKTGHLLTDQLIFDDTACGWDKLVTKREQIGTIGSSIGLSIMRLTGFSDKRFLVNKDRIISTIWSRRKNTGGFSAIVNTTSFFEATCWVAKAMLDCNEIEKFSYAVNDTLLLLECTNLKDLSICSMSMILNVIIDYHIIKNDEKSKIMCDNIANEMVTRFINRAEDENSAIEVARTILCINKYCHMLSHKKNFIDCLKRSRKFLLENVSKWNDVNERIRRNNEEMAYEHYALPWCLSALLDMGVNDSCSVIREGVAKLLSTYNEGEWRRNGTTKIWEIHDSLMTITMIGDALLY